LTAPGTSAREPVLLACDLDGTLLDYEAAPVPGAGEALIELIAAGALFVVCTGRPLQAARRATDALGAQPVVFACYHGALVAEASGRILRHQPLPPAEAREIAAEALAAGVAVTVWDVDEPRELEPGGEGEEPGGAVSRLVLHGEPVTVGRLLGALRGEWAGRLRVEPIRPGFLGVFAPAVDKGDALRFVAGRLGVPLDRTVACGDGRADETLLAAAAVRVAVGEAPHALGHLPEVVVTSWARLPDTLRALVLPLL
jgi:hydroxymethylpyrimidine pyrophosphatase-like HAD family hydrolase